MNIFYEFPNQSFSYFLLKFSLFSSKNHLFSQIQQKTQLFWALYATIPNFWKNHIIFKRGKTSFFRKNIHQFWDIT